MFLSAVVVVEALALLWRCCCVEYVFVLESGSISRKNTESLYKNEIYYIL